MKGIPGELHERPWKNFEHNRNEALALAKNKGDYTLFMDADEQIGRSNNFSMPKLDKDYYYIKVRQEGSDCLRVFLVRDSLNWRWQGVLHEELFCFEATTFDTLDGAVIEAHFRDGNRTQDPQKYFKDAKVLEEALEKDPTNARYVIFLAQSYHCAGDLHASLKNYQKRAQMGGRDEEVFWSLFQVASLKDELGYPSEKLRSKSWEEFSTTDAPKMDFIISLYDPSNGEAVPHLPSNPASAFWTFPDPSNLSNDPQLQRRAMRAIMVGLKKRIEILASLPINQLDSIAIQKKLAEINQIA